MSGASFDEGRGRFETWEDEDLLSCDRGVIYFGTFRDGGPFFSFIFIFLNMFSRIFVSESISLLFARGGDFEFSLFGVFFAKHRVAGAGISN